VLPPGSNLYYAPHGDLDEEKTMKLSYWVAAHKNAHRPDAIVARTKHDCEQKMLAFGSPENYLAPVKKSFLYDDAFDLFEMATAGDGGRGMG
jgi:hypothetical protein